MEGEKQKLIEVVLNGFDKGISVAMIANIMNRSEEEAVSILIENSRSV